MTTQERKAAIEHAMNGDVRRGWFNMGAALVFAAMLIALSLLWNQVNENTRAVNQLQQYVVTACQPVNTNPTTKANAPADTQNVCNKAQNNQLPGPAGPQGSTGPQGASGATGATGPVGSAGPQGSAGPRGSQGAAGANGKDGATGATGATGAQGSPGPVGSTGPQGPAGPSGKAGTDGKDGRGIASTQCTNGEWTVTYTDGTTANAGSCSALP